MRYQKILESYLKLCLFGFGTFSSLLIPIVPLHELGHVMACNATGGRGEITEFNQARCYDGNNRQFMRFAGGALGTAGASVPWILWRRFKERITFRGIIIGASAFAVLEFQKAIWEAVNYTFYISDGAEKLFLSLSLVVAVMLLVLFRPQENADANR